MTGCSHTDQVRISRLPESVEGCEDCLAEGTEWFHLRLCLGCGHVGCCDSSPRRHATRHFERTAHPLARSIEPGEEWSWCFVDEVAILIPGIEGQTAIPPSPLA